MTPHIKHTVPPKRFIKFIRCADCGQVVCDASCPGWEK